MQRIDKAMRGGKLVVWSHYAVILTLCVRGMQCAAITGLDCCARAICNGRTRHRFAGDRIKILIISIRFRESIPIDSTHESNRTDLNPQL